MCREEGNLSGVWWILALILSFGHLPSQQSTGLPCVYEGSLHTNDDWFGYLSNVTIMTTGRMSFEFSYPADMCCQNILFYLEDQMSIINARMNCWQKEALLRPEDDQILRLTPRFSWSGCHMVYPNGIAMYTCQGGRSFASTTQGERPTTWYIAVSNCASLEGLQLKYRVVIDGHIGECRNGHAMEKTSTAMPTPSPQLLSTEIIIPEDPVTWNSRRNVKGTCVLEGYLTYKEKWFGYLISNVSLAQGGGIKFRFSYPYRMQTQHVIVYTERDRVKLRDEQNCWQKEGIIPSGSVADQIIDLGFRSTWNGCAPKNTTRGLNLVCNGQRVYSEPRTVHLAVSNCRSREGLRLHFHLEISGYTGKDLCSRGIRPQGTQSSNILLICLVSVAVILYMQGLVHSAVPAAR